MIMSGGGGERERETDKQTDRQTQTYRDRQIETDRQTGSLKAIKYNEKKMYSDENVQRLLCASC